MLGDGGDMRLVGEKEKMGKKGEREAWRRRGKQRDERPLAFHRVILTPIKGGEQNRTLQILPFREKDFKLVMILNLLKK